MRLLLALLLASSAVAQTADTALLVVHTDQHYRLFLTRAEQDNPREACGPGHPILTNDANYLELSDAVPVGQALRICFEPIARREPFLSPVFTAPPLSEGIALVLIVRNQAVTVVRQPVPANRADGIWPAALGDCRSARRVMKQSCWYQLQGAGVSAQTVCAAESPFPENMNRQMCFGIFRTPDPREPAAPEDLAALVADSAASIADRERALDEIRRRKLAVAVPILVRVAQAPPSPPERNLQVYAVVALFELSDARATLAARAVLSRSGTDARQQELLSALGGLSDRASLRLLTEMLYSGRPGDDYYAVLGLRQRHEPEVETILVQKFLRPDTRGNAYSTIFAYLVESRSDVAARALLAWAAPRRVVRDYVGGVFRGWIAARGAAVVGQLAALAHGEAPKIASLAGGFLGRCTGHEFGSPRAWIAWASQQPAHYWALVSKDSACTLPGSPDGGEPADGTRYLQVVRATLTYREGGRAKPPGEPLRAVHEGTFKALQAPLYPYLMAFDRRCFRLSQDQSRSVLRTVGEHDYIAPGDTFSAADVGGGGDFAALDPAPCSPAHPVAEDDGGELVFFVGEGKYRVTFKYVTLPTRYDIPAAHPH